MSLLLSSYLRKTFLLYGGLPVQELPSRRPEPSSTTPSVVVEGSNNSDDDDVDKNPVPADNNNNNTEPPPEEVVVVQLTDGTMPTSVKEAKEIVHKELLLHNNLNQFPKDFFWGTATAAYQIEGGLFSCNWSEWEKQGQRIFDGHATVENHEKAGMACNGWEMFDVDLKAMKKLGIKMYRFSIEWSRIEPTKGKFDLKVLETYKCWCQKLKSSGIEPMITLHHFTEPSWFSSADSEAGASGWEKRDNLKYFERYVNKATEVLAPYCRYWSTINELNGYVVCGWLAGVHPPGKQNDVRQMLQVFRNLMVAHTIAANSIRKASAVCRPQREEPIICLPLNHVYFLPFDSRLFPFQPSSKNSRLKTFFEYFLWFLNRLVSIIVSLFLNYVYNFVLLDAIFLGRFPNFPFPFHFAATIAGWNDDIKALYQTSDWIGINHYYRSYVQFGLSKSKSSSNSSAGGASPTDMFIPLPFFGIELRASSIPNFEKNEMGWDLTPSSMMRLLEIISDRYNNTTPRSSGAPIPIIITESGVADRTDQKRVRYIVGLLKLLHDNILLSKQQKHEQQKQQHCQEGRIIDLRGYLIWTLMDNFEWAEGYRPKFGLLETNFNNNNDHNNNGDNDGTSLYLERKERKETCDILRSIFGTGTDDG